MTSFEALLKAMDAVPTFAGAVAAMQPKKARIGQKGAKQSLAPGQATAQPTAPTVDPDPEKARIKGAMMKMGAVAQAPVKAPAAMSAAPMLKALANVAPPEHVDRLKALTDSAKKMQAFYGTMDMKDFSARSYHGHLSDVHFHLGTTENELNSGELSRAEALRHAVGGRGLEARNLDAAHSKLIAAQHHAMAYGKNNNVAIPDFGIPARASKPGLLSRLKDRIMGEAKSSSQSASTSATTPAATPARGPVTQAPTVATPIAAPAAASTGASPKVVKTKARAAAAPAPASPQVVGNITPGSASSNAFGAITGAVRKLAARGNVP